MSIRKRTWKTAKGDAKEAWIVDYSDQAGKRRMKTFARKKDADAYQARAKVDVGEGIHTADSVSVTVAAAADLWLKTCVGRELERSTIAAYERQTRLHIVPAIGQTKLSRLTAPLVREFEDGLRGAGTSSAMIRKILVTLGSILADAQERGLIARNVMRDLRARRKKGVDRRADRRQKGRLRIGVHIPTWEEIRAIVANLSGRWRPVLLTAIFTGLRSSELRGLRWSDVDLKKSELHVRQRIDQYRKFGAPKSEAGDRTVPLPPIVLNTLREWKLACPKSEDDLVFPSSRGTPEGHGNLIKTGLIPAVVAAGVLDAGGKPKYTGLHCLRHFYASWIINAREDGGLGLSAKAAQSHLGHSSIAMTLDCYGHLFPSGDDGSALAAAERSLIG